MTTGEPADGALVAAKGLRVRFGGTVALDGVDVAIHPGEIVTVIGPNGAGKTTLARIILGLSRPEAGTVRRRRGVTCGYVPQRFHVDPTLPMTVGRFLALPVHPGADAIARALTDVGVPDLAGRALQSLSGGEFQRVMLARALLRRPELLVLDEPLQGVDFAGQIALFDLIGELRDRHGFGVLMVSHDLHIVMRATDRVLCINRHVCCSGAPETVSRHPEYLQLFGPEAARALAVYPHQHDHVHDVAGNIRAHEADGLRVAPAAETAGAPSPRTNAPGEG